MDDWRTVVLQDERLGQKSLLDAMSDNLMGAFNGSGRHCINDFGHVARLWLGAPSRVVCSDDTSFAEFKAAYFTFMSQWDSPKFIKRVAGHVNSSNPFAFNESADREYCHGYIKVFRSTSARMPAALYNEYVSRGLFDVNHTFGEPQFF